MSRKPVILVVDDDLPILILMRNILREFGFDPETAATGQDAIATARTRVPDVILLDLKMPGMTGEEVIAGLREARVGDVPILILSGEPVDPQESARLGVAGAIQKPFDVPELVETIRAHAGVTRP